MSSYQGLGLSPRLRTTGLPTTEKLLVPSWKQPRGDGHLPSPTLLQAWNYSSHLTARTAPHPVSP